MDAEERAIREVRGAHASRRSCAGRRRKLPLILEKLIEDCVLLAL